MPSPDDPVAPIAGRVQERIRALLDGHRATWIAEQPALAALFDALDGFVAAGGKRLRPAFCYWGAVAAGAGGDEPELLDTCAALELLHAFALIHDDVMDGSATRRGRPALHVRFASRHSASGWVGDSRRHGEGLAILAGDLAFVLADTLLDRAPPEAQRLWHELRVELVAGQWVDVVAAASTERSPALARWVGRYKSGRYTVERPLHLGAALAGDPRLCDAYSAFGEPLGEAFQLRDDLLGVFGDPSETGKPSGDDLREGKPTLLLALATSLAEPDDRGLIERVGSADLSDDDVMALRRAFHRCGARDMVEDEIVRLTTHAEQALADCDIDAVARHRLLSLARRAAVRDR
jgi:geranylgeranyl diphosphate synthase type I